MVLLQGVLNIDWIDISCVWYKHLFKGIGRFNVPFCWSCTLKDDAHPIQTCPRLSYLLLWIGLYKEESERMLQQFMGSVNYLSKFLAFLSDLHAPLQPLLKKWFRIHLLQWENSHMDQLCNCIKECVSKCQQLHSLPLCNSSKPLFIEVNCIKMRNWCSYALQYVILLSKGFLSCSNGWEFLTSYSDATLQYGICKYRRVRDYESNWLQYWERIDLVLFLQWLTSNTLQGILKIADHYHTIW